MRQSTYTLIQSRIFGNQHKKQQTQREYKKNLSYHCEYTHEKLVTKNTRKTNPSIVNALMIPYSRHESFMNMSLCNSLSAIPQQSIFGQYGYIERSWHLIYTCTYNATRHTLTLMRFESDIQHTPVTRLYIHMFTCSADDIPFSEKQFMSFKTYCLFHITRNSR